MKSSVKRHEAHRKAEVRQRPSGWTEDAPSGGATSGRPWTWPEPALTPDQAAAQDGVTRLQNVAFYGTGTVLG